MTQCLDPQPTDKVLEIGTGSGYQAAVLSHLVKEVYTIEIVEPLGKTAAQAFKRLGYDNVHVKIGDGYLGWPEHAPFDKIIVTCSPEKVAAAAGRATQGGRPLVIPVGERYQQMLYLFGRKTGKLEAEPLQPTFFVPMTGVAEQQRADQARSTEPTYPQWRFRSHRPAKTATSPAGSTSVKGRGRPARMHRRANTMSVSETGRPGQRSPAARLRDRRAENSRDRNLGAGPCNQVQPDRTPGGVPRRGDQFLRRNP